MKTNTTFDLAGASLPHGHDKRFSVRANLGFAYAMVSDCSSAPPF